MKFSIEQDSRYEEAKISILCAQRTDDILALEKLILDFLEQREKQSQKILGLKDDAEYFLLPKNILFFQTEANNVYAHTELDSYLTKYKLYELENLLPIFFQRISKSTLINTEKILSVKRELSGSAILYLNQSSKKVYCSRAYYHELRTKLLIKY